MSGGRLLFYVQHLLGTGHLRRAARLAAGCRRAGFRVDMASGGMPEPGLAVDGVRLLQLPPVRAADADFADLLDPQGGVIDDAYRSRRREALLAHFQEVRPDALVIEGFPFGRRKFRFELVPLLEAAHRCRPRPLVFASVRDIIQPKHKASRDREIVDLIEAYFDGVLVHGDPALVRLEESFPLAAEIGDKLAYTGYVAPAPDEADDPVAVGAGEVVVSAGGGAVGHALFAAAIAARPMTRARDATWRLLVGTKTSDSDGEALAACAPEGVVVEPVRSDFVQLLRHCAVSVSQAGYNTTMDVLWARARAVLVPFARSGEAEQSLRAARIAAKGWATVVAEADLTPRRLARAVDRALDSPPADPAGLDLGGADAGAALIVERLAARPAARARASDQKATNG